MAGPLMKYLKSQNGAALLGRDAIKARFKILK